MSKFGRGSILTGVGVFLEGSALYLAFSIVSSLIALPDARIPFWLTLLTLLWAFLLSLYLQTIRFSLNLKGFFGLVISVASLIFLANLSHGLGLLPIGTIIAGAWIDAITITFTLVFLTILWWRGGAMAHDDVTLDTIRGSFQWGMVVVVIAVLIDAFTPRNITSGVFFKGSAFFLKNIEIRKLIFFLFELPGNNAKCAIRIVFHKNPWNIGKEGCK